MNSELRAISAVIKDGDVPALLEVSPEIFESFGDVYEFILTYYQKNKDMPPRKIVEDKFALTLTEDVGTTRHHVEELRNVYVKRQVRNILQDASQKLQNGQLVDAVNAMVAAASELRRDTSDFRDLDVIDVESAIEYLRKVQDEAALGVYGVTFGIPGIDDFLPAGVTPGQFGLIMGYPGRGKSFLSTLMAVRAWDRGKKVLYVSLEMLESEVRARVYAIAGEGKWSLRDLQRGKVDIEDFRTWANDRFDGRGPFPIISNDGTGRFTPNILRAKIEEYKPDIVFVDYLQLMAPDDGNEGNETVKLKRLSTDLKILATAMRVSIVAVVSATPGDASDIESIPELFAVAWSKQLAYDADWLLAVGRADNSPLMGIAWRKNRNGPLSDFALDCDFNSGIFTYSENDFM